jgi:hypothetical protein
MPAPRKQTGRKVDVVAWDTTNKRDWFIVEILRVRNEVLTKILRELVIMRSCILLTLVFDTSTVCSFLGLCISNGEHEWDVLEQDVRNE